MCKLEIGAAVIVGLILLVAAPTPAGENHRPCHELAAGIGTDSSFLLASPSGFTICSKNREKQLIPASILKLLTVLAVFDQLGPGYRFVTEFYLTKESDLVIKGYGDPLLISEVVDDAASQLAGKVSSIRNIMLDDTFFQQPLKVPGRSNSSQPYDAPNGALCVNFNTVNFKTNKGRFVSAEPQTPLLPLALAKISRQNLRYGRITLSGNNRETLAYTGQMFAYFLRKKGIRISGCVKTKPDGVVIGKPLLVFASPFTIRQAAAKLLVFSNNFIANQLLLAAGAKAYGAPATMEKAVRLLKSYARKVCNLQPPNLVEGSGISRHNRISAACMLKILLRFKPHYRLMRYDPVHSQFYKTGTLKGISTRAGFIRDRANQLWPFVIMGHSLKQAEKILKLFSVTVSPDTRVVNHLPLKNGR